MAEVPAPHDRRRRFLLSVGGGFVLGLIVIAVVAASRGEDKPRRAPILFADRLPVTPTQLKVEPPTRRTGCTNIWTGKAKTSRWSDAANWSANRLPGESDRACLGPGSVVTLAAARARVGSVAAEGSLYLIAGAELVLLDISRHSTLAGLVLNGGKLDGDADVVITALKWLDGGWMTGAGTTILPKRGSAIFAAGDGGRGVIGARRRLDFRGRFELQSGALYLDSTADFKVSGRVSVNPRSPTGKPQGLLQRRNGLPVLLGAGLKRAPGFVVGTPGKHPRPGP